MSSNSWKIDEEFTMVIREEPSFIKLDAALSPNTNVISDFEQTIDFWL